VDNYWGEIVKVGMIGAIGFTVTGSDLDLFLRLGIGMATLAYGIAKASTAWLEFLRKKKNEKCD